MGAIAITKRFLFWIMVSMVAKCLLKGGENLACGKDIWGRKYVERKKAFKTWDGKIVAGKYDYQIN